jgi:hypothetical protein
MGKKIRISFRQTRPDVTTEISRSKLIELVDLSIGEATSEASLENVDLLNPDVIREIARTTHQIDACTWKNAGSCGCPLTAAGRVSLVGEDESGSSAPGVYRKFFTTFDRLAKQYAQGVLGHPIGGSILFKVVDD